MFNNKGYSRILKVCGVIALLALGYIILILERPNDIKLLQKPLTMEGFRKVKDPASGFDDNNNMVLCEVVLSTNTLIGRQYKLVDSPDDGYFPNDADGLVDRVSKRDRSKSGRWSTRLSRYTPWTKMPFEPELYQIATEKYKESLVK
ncbi:MAG: hypothetical protein ACYS6K_03470 [Planctomycetota bacterium]|jgi:hypothetical protein